MQSQNTNNEGYIQDATLVLYGTKQLPMHMQSAGP